MNSEDMTHEELANEAIRAGRARNDDALIDTASSAPVAPIFCHDPSWGQRDGFYGVGRYGVDFLVLRARNGAAEEHLKKLGAIKTLGSADHWVANASRGADITGILETMPKEAE